MNDPLYPGTTSVEGELELTHSDKAAGIFTEPSATFAAAAKFPPKTIDWLLPLMIFILVAVISFVALRSNPEVKRQMIEFISESRAKQLEGDIRSGKMTQQAAEEQIEMTKSYMENGGVFLIVITSVQMLFFVFLPFFVTSGVYFLVYKVILKGDGKFSSVLVANGLPYYIHILQVIVMTIIALAFSKYLMGTSVTALAGLNKETFIGFLLNKVDIFIIWSLAVTGIALAKMFKHPDAKKSLSIIFGIWIVWSFIAFGLATAVPALSFLNM